jgi:hypothetical protein
MSTFINSFKTIIEGDPSINALLTGGIYFVHLPDNFDISKTYLVWDFRVNEQFNTMDIKNFYSVYTVQVTVTSTDSVLMNNISDLVSEYLNNATSSNFLSIRKLTDNKLTTLAKPKNTYQNSLEFNIVFIE